MFSVRGHIQLEAEASRAWAAVRSSQLPEWSICVIENRLASGVATKGGSFQHTSADSLDL